MWPFNSPLPWQRSGIGGLPAAPPGMAAGTPAGGAATAPQGGMFNAWPTMLSGPSGSPSVSDAARNAVGIGGPIAALQFLLQSGGRSQGVMDAIRANAARAGLPDPFAQATPMSGSNLGQAMATGAGMQQSSDAGGAVAPQQPPAIPDMTGAQYPQPFTIGPEGVPMPRRRPNFSGVPMPQARPDIPQAPAPNYYNGPGSMSFGAGDGPSGNNYGNQGILSALFGGR